LDADLDKDVLSEYFDALPVVETHWAGVINRYQKIDNYPEPRDERKTEKSGFL
jgi:hypothetical protein